MQYVVKYKLFFHTLFKEIEDTIKLDNGLSYFIGKRNFSVYKEDDAIEFLEKNRNLNFSEFFYNMTLGLANFKKKKY